MFPFRKQRSGCNLLRRYDAVGSGSDSSEGDEERGGTSSSAESGTFPSNKERASEATQPAKPRTSPNRVPDPWSQQNLGEDPTLTAAETDDSIPTPQEAELLEAWMIKRKAQRLEQEQQRFQSMMDPRTGGFQQKSNTPPRKNQQAAPESQQPPWFMHHPVDVDTGVEIIEKFDDSEIQYIPTATATIIAEDTLTVNSKPGSIASYPSNSTSDMTPVVSNKTFKARHRPSQSASISHSLTTAHESPETGGAGAGENTNDGNNDGSCAKQCQAFLDVRTYHGKLALLLLVILVLAVTTMVVSALLARQSRNIIDSNKGESPPVVVTPEPTTPQPSMTPSLRPTVAPTMTPSYLPTSSVGSGSPTYLPSTLAPSTSAPTGEDYTPPPTVSPTTAQPTTLAPSTTFPTAQPSVAPSTAQPTTIAPTELPTTLAPTDQPTIYPTTAAPTIEPLEDLVLVPGDVVEGPSSDAQFGSSVALSGDGRVMVVGAPGYDRRSGRVEVFELVDFPGDPVPRQWVERDTITGTVSEGTLGQAVAVSRDGSILAVSEPNVERRAGRVTVYAYIPGSQAYEQLGSPILGSALTSYSGTSIALSADGLRLAVGAPYYSGVNNVQLHGQVVVYELNGSEWTPMGNPISGQRTLDWLGSAVALSDDGLKVVASAPRNSNLNGYVGTWEWSAESGDWVPWGSGIVSNDFVPALSSDRFGHSVALSATPEGVSRLVVGIPWKSVSGQRNSGMVVIYELDPSGTQWEQLGEPIVQDPPSASSETGSAVDLLDGRILLVGIPGAVNRAGQVRLYRFDEEDRIWEEHPVPLTGGTPGDDFGVALAAQREVEIDHQGLSLVVGAIAQNRGGIGYVQSFLEE